jgi:4-azaleucine resistance transporter AzlC
MEISLPPSNRRREFWRGVRDESPILLGVAPFGLIFGALAVNANISIPAAQAMSSIIFAGASQIIAAQMVGAGASLLVIVLVVFVVNLRHALYSASVAPYVQHLSPGWKMILAYLLTDEAYAVTISNYNKGGDPAKKHWYFLGSGLTLWSTWQVTTALGIFIGAQLPQSWPLDFVLPLTFIALVVPALKDKAGVAAAVSAGLVGMLTLGFPFKTGLLVAAFVGIIVGLLLERKPE